MVQASNVNSSQNLIHTLVDSLHTTSELWKLMMCYYWKLLVGRKSATILPVSRSYVPQAYENLFIATKLFAIHMNSMAEEQTVSTFI